MNVPPIFRTRRVVQNRNASPGPLCADLGKMGNCDSTPNKKITGSPMVGEKTHEKVTELNFLVHECSYVPNPLGLSCYQFMALQARYCTFYGNQ